MHLYFYTEARFVLANDGKIYNPSGVQKKDIFQRYLQVFDKIYIVARVIQNNQYIINENHIVEDENIRVLPITYYNGFLDYLSKYFKVHRDIKIIVEKSNNAVHLLRLPGNLGTIASKYLKKNNIKYGVEVVGDPFDVFDNKIYKNPLLFLVKYKSYFDLKKIVKDSWSALYVTKHTLQKRYPAKKMFTASNVSISYENIIKLPKKISNLNEIKILCIGTLEQMYKSPDTVIKLVHKLREDGECVILNWIGEGKYKNEMLNLVKEYNLENAVKFTGYISDKSKLYDEIDQSDLFIIASKTEGLPRVVIEVFSRGLPVIGTKVGGIPELIPDELLCEVDDIDRMKYLVKELIRNENFYSYHSIRNINCSKQYTEDILQENRIEFYNSLLLTNQNER